MILHFGNWHGELPLVSQVYSERVLPSRVPLLLRGKLWRTAGIELYIFGISANGVKSADGGRSGFGDQSGHSVGRGSAQMPEAVASSRFSQVDAASVGLYPDRALSSTGVATPELSKSNLSCVSMRLGPAHRDDMVKSEGGGSRVYAEADGLRWETLPLKTDRAIVPESKPAKPASPVRGASRGLHRPNHFAASAY